MARRPYISWIALLLGLAVGLALGLVYTWVISPVVEFDTQPSQLSAEARVQYLTAISLAYRADGDLRHAVDHLLELSLPGDPFQFVADTACNLFRQGITTNSQRNAIEAMIALYRPQGRTGCADESNLFEVAQATPTPFPTAIPVTPSLTPPPSKTPTLAAPLDVTPATMAPTRTPTDVPQPNDYAIAPVQTFCSVELAGTIEVYLREPGQRQVPGIEVQVSWENGSDHFFTGLKPERGAGYADFQMEANRTYYVQLPGRSPRTGGLTATQCTTDSGQTSTTSYRVIFVRN
jgi:hypothetical protein